MYDALGLIIHNMDLDLDQTLSAEIYGDQFALNGIQVVSISLMEQNIKYISTSQI